MNTAIVLITYNRPDSFKRIIQSLEEAIYPDDNIPLIISIDKSDSDVQEKMADEYIWPHGPKTVVKHAQNLGLRKHILSQGRLFETYDALVILEDDLVVAQDYWNYVTQTVDKYHNTEDIAGISLYSFAVNYHLRQPFTPLRDGNDVYFMNCAMSWGEVWMKKQWKAFEDWYSKNKEFKNTRNLPDSICSWSDKSWLKHHTRYCIENNKYFVFPYVSYTTNFSDAGTHMQVQDTIFQVPLLEGQIEKLRLPNFGGNATYYDVFFENKALYRALELSENECCLDLNNTNGNKSQKRFWLTTRKCCYHVVKSFDYGYRPIEKNILSSNEGSGIYLYDTTRTAPKPELKGNPAFLAKFFIQNGLLFAIEYGIGNMIKEFYKLLSAKITK